MKIIKKIYKKVLLSVIIGYVACVFVSQQQTIDNYKREINQYDEQIQEAKDTKESLIAMKDNVNSPEYIEEIAREKLGMYLPNERVYIDIEK